MLTSTNSLGWMMDRNLVKMSRRSIKSNEMSKVHVIVMQTSYNLISELRTSSIANQQCCRRLCNFRKRSRTSFIFSSKTANIPNLLTNSMNCQTRLKRALAFLFFALTCPHMSQRHWQEKD